MDDENAQVHVSNHAAVGKSGGKQKKIKSRHIAGLVAVVAVLALLAFGLWNVYGTTTGAQLDSSKYQAVFFTNGQVYFGKLSNVNGSYMRLTDVFYLQTQEAEQKDSANPQQTSDQDLQLIKLGSEIHGPEDEMVISKDQVLFFENLKNDGKVTQSINEYNNSQNQ